MTWALIAVLAAVVYAAMVFLFKVPRGGREAIGAAMLLGIAGYALQGHPGLPGSPTAPREKVQADAGASVEARREMSPGSAKGEKWLVIADALARNGNYGAAAQVLRGAVTKNPDDADAWLAMANALVSHADGRISPAALYAFDKAQTAAPGSPGPPLFLGLALAQSGQLAEGRAVWADLLARSPADAPWRADVAERLAQLDAFIAEREGARNSPR